MAEQRTTRRRERQVFPDIGVANYLKLRSRFQAAPPNQVTAAYLEGVLQVSLKSGQNILPQVRALGLIDENGRLTDLAHDWRLDEHYGSAVQQIRDHLYPQELRDTFPCPDPDVAGVARWMARRSTVGTARALNMARVYALLCRAEPASRDWNRRVRDKRSLGSQGQRQAPEAGAPQPSRPPSNKRRQPLTADPRGDPVSTPLAVLANVDAHPSADAVPQIHFNIQVHLPQNGTPEAYDAILASIARHLLGRSVD